MTFSGRRGGGRSGRSFRGGSTVRTIRGGGIRTSRSFGSSARGTGIRTGRGTVGGGSVHVGSQVRGTTQVTITPYISEDAFRVAGASLATGFGPGAQVARIRGGEPSAPSPTKPTHADVRVEVVWKAEAIVSTTWQRSQSDAGSVAFTVADSFTLSQTRVPIDLAIGIAENMLDRAIRQAESLALSKASNLSNQAVAKAAGQAQDYLRIGNARISKVSLV